MHELAICNGLIDELRSIAHERSATRICSVELCIGPLAGVETESLRQAFSLASVGTLAESAQLNIERTPIRLKCGECGAETQTPHVNQLTCGDCGSWRTSVLEGGELLLTRVELEAASAEEPPASTSRTAGPAH